MLVEISVQEVITYKKIIEISEEEYTEFLTDSPDPAFDMYNCYMSLENVVGFDYINSKVEEYKK